LRSRQNPPPAVPVQHGRRPALTNSLLDNPPALHPRHIAIADILADRGPVLVEILKEAGRARVERRGEDTGRWDAIDEQGALLMVESDVSFRHPKLTTRSTP
jgi:hypothetical protein